ncbi:DUF6268 family outer membrane beta-barrel protein [Hymenobacter psychrophilus]|uniref:DUF6268 domain-containing protein n=1 Tax=Hymenobacter psychrophilus TaxID=651662 RepID=A0A1H3EY36_9BACT|nr:DUF6268 family outer membrane beta-barrel protein [Hymenobacter psychrophilus]SDX83520.1 hypothetical protein SAMN04488069_103350 [Hymenobacter psychrophilus]
MPFFYLRSRRLFYYLSAAAVLAGSAAQAQVTPRTPPVYPPPAPLATDTLAANQVGQAQEFAVPSVIGMGPSKGVVAHIEALSNFSITSQINDREPKERTENTVTKNRRAFIKAYAPLLNNPHLKVILGLNYDREEFQFADPNKSVFYRDLEDKGLKVIGTQLAVIRPVDEVHWYLARVKAELNGDYTSSELNVSDYLRTSGEFIYGWKRSPYYSWGVGAQLSYTFGRQSLYPVILYNRTFNSRWGVESLFPARVTLRRNLDPKTLLFGGYTVDGSNYNIKLREPLGELRTLIVRQRELKFRLRAEREIYDFLWFGVEGGYRYNAGFSAFNEDNYRRSLFNILGGGRTQAVDNTLGGAPYVSVELFLVPPRKLLNRLAK